MRGAVLRSLLSLLVMTWSAVPASAQAASDEGPLASRLFFGSTGRALAPGEAYLSITSLFLPAVQVGVMDRFSVGVGLPFYGAAKSIYFTPRLQVYRSPSTQVSAGLVHVFIRGFIEGGYAHVTGTMGGSNASVTVGGGLLYGKEGGSRRAAPMFKIGGERRLSARRKFITENYITPAGVIVTAGTRVTRARSSWDFATFVAIGPGGPIGPPGVVINFYWHR